jgi:hypothetical protein
MNHFGWRHKQENFCQGGPRWRRTGDSGGLTSPRWHQMASDGRTRRKTRA